MTSVRSGLDAKPTQTSLDCLSDITCAGSGLLPIGNPGPQLDPPINIRHRKPPTSPNLKARICLASAGVLLAPIYSIHPAMGQEILTPAFVVVVIGGLGSFWGVILAALLVGVVRGITVAIGYVRIDTTYDCRCRRTLSRSARQRSIRLRGSRSIAAATLAVANRSLPKLMQERQVFTRPTCEGLFSYIRRYRAYRLRLSKARLDTPNRGLDFEDASRSLNGGYWVHDAWRCTSRIPHEKGKRS